MRRTLSGMDLRFPDATFRADPPRRLLSGLLVPWNVPTQSGGRWYVFKPDSLYWRDVSRVKLNRGHNLHDAVGVATALQTRMPVWRGRFGWRPGPTAMRPCGWPLRVSPMGSPSR
jgi:hypothetical protein